MYKKIKLPKVTTLRNIAEGDFTENERKVLQFIQDNKIPVTVFMRTVDGANYFDVEIDDVISIPSLSGYHLTGFPD